MTKLEQVQNRRRQHPRPSNFLPAGEVTSARISTEPPYWLARKKSTGKRRAGEIFEKRAQEYLQGAHDFYTPAPWIVFTSRRITRPRWCQPDGLILDVTTGICTIVEIKLKHTPRAWWQVRKLYEPVVRCLLARSSFSFAALEVVRHIDNQTPFPERWGYVRDLDCLRPEVFGVHVYRP